MEGLFLALGEERIRKKNQQQKPETSVEMKEVSGRVRLVVQRFPGLRMDPGRGSSNGLAKYIHAY